MRERFVMVIPPSLMEAMRREVDRLAVAEVTTDAEGATLVTVLQVREPDSLTDDDKGLLGIVNICPFTAETCLTLCAARLNSSTDAARRLSDSATFCAALIC